MGYYHLLRDHNAAQHVWALMGLAAHMAENVGCFDFDKNDLDLI